MMFKILKWVFIAFLAYEAYLFVGPQKVDGFVGKTGEIVKNSLGDLSSTIKS